MYPTLFTFGPLTLSTLWIFIILGTYVFLKFFIKNIQKHRGDFKFVYEESTFLLISFIVGARLTSVIGNIGDYIQDLGSFLHIFAIWDKGFSFWGGMIVTLLALRYKTKQVKEPFKKWMDYLCEPFLYAMPIVAIGRFFDGAGYGSKTDLPFGVSFINMDVAIVTPVHPVQLYSALLFCLVIFIVRRWNIRYKEYAEYDGAKASLVICLSSLAIFIENLFRGDPSLEIFGIRIGLFIASAVAAASAYYLYKLIHKSA